MLLLSGWLIGFVEKHIEVLDSNLLSCFIYLYLFVVVCYGIFDFIYEKIVDDEKI